MMSIVDLGKRLVISAKLGETDEVRLLMTNGAPFTTDWFGASPLHMAAQYGHVDTAEVLLRAGISRDARTKVDRTPLHLAAQEGHKAIVELLIKHGADVNAVDMLKMTPLHWAVERSHILVIKCLLRCDADVHAINKFYKTPMDIADDNGADGIMQILQNYSNNPKRAKPKETYQQKVPLSSISKNPVIIQTQQAVGPFNIIKADSISAEQLKNIVNRTVRVIDSSGNSAATIASCANTSAKISYSSRPIFIRANLGQPTSLKNNHSKSTTVVDSNSTTQSCTNVLATLAALAEATAPNARFSSRFLAGYHPTGTMFNPTTLNQLAISTQEALQWLETHGISMLPSDNSSVVASALEGGQTVSLTEAGKLALTWVKEQQNISKESTSSAQDITVVNRALSNNVTIPDQKIIAFVPGQTQLPSIISTQQPVVIVGSHGSKIDGQPPIKKIKTYLSKKDMKPATNGKNFTSVVMENERSLLQKELEKTKKEAAEYKAQLLLKEHEAALYRKQLEQLKRSQ